MTKAKTKPSLPVPGAGLKFPASGMPFVVYAQGVGLFEQLRANSTVALALDDGTSRDATVQSVQVGALIDLVASQGPQSVYTAGRVYSALSLVQALTDASPDDVIDVTKLYTAVMVVLPVDAPAPLAPVGA